MKTDLLVFDKYFDATYKEVHILIFKYLDKLVEWKPEVTMKPTTREEDGKKISKINIIESKEWGIDEVDYGYIEVIPAYLNSLKPMQVKLYCSHPDYISYWSGLGNTLLKNLPPSDGSPDPSSNLWNLIPDVGDDREMVRLWVDKKMKAKEIGKRLGYSESRIFDRLRILRNEHDDKVIPYKKKWRKKSKD